MKRHLGLVPVVAALAAACSHGQTLPEVEPARWPTEVREPLARGDLAGAAAAAEVLETQGEEPLAALVRITVAARGHDPGALRAALAHPSVEVLRTSPKLRAHVALAQTSVEGLVPSRPALDAACLDKSGGMDAELASEVCSKAALAACLEGKPLSLEGEVEVEAPLLPKLPLPIVLASVNGRPPAPFIVDTGAAGTVLSKAWADARGIPYLAGHPRISRDAAGHDVPLIPVALDRFDLGGVVARHVDAVVIELPPNFKAGGILAPHRTFPGAVVELDLRADKLRVHRGQTAEAWAASLAEPVHTAPLHWDDGNVFVRGTLGAGAGALTGYVNFDTGAAGSIVTVETAARAGHPVDPGSATEGQSVTKHAAWPAFRAAFALEGGPVSEEAFTPIERRQGEVGMASLGNVGVPWMKGRRLAISPDGRFLLCTERASP